MSSGFTSGGSLENPIERDDEWLKAQTELDQERARKAEIQRQQGSKSLYEVLQANKAAKQEQFEESIKLKNQFRALDDDEIDFLDSVLEKERQKEDTVRKETLRQLQGFAKAQNEEESQAKLRQSDHPETEDNPDWSVKPKRKRQEKEGLRRLKFSKTTTEQSKIVETTSPSKIIVAEANIIKGPFIDCEAVASATKPRQSIDKIAPTVKSAGLVAYASSEDSDENEDV